MAQSSEKKNESVSLSGPALCLFAVVLTVPFPTILHKFNQNRSYDFQTLLFPVDVALFILLVVAAAPIVRDLRARRLGAGWTCWLLLAIALTAAWLAHPSQRGVHTLLELYGVVAVAHTVANLEKRTELRLILGMIAFVAIMETAWSALQRITLGPLGLERLGELPDPLYRFGRDAIAAQGSMIHIYVLAGFALVAAAIFATTALSESKSGWVICAAMAIAPVGMTYSRAALLGVVLLVSAISLVGAPPLRRRSILLAACIVVGAAIPALVWSGGWRNRATQTTSAGNAAALTTDRGQLDHEAFQTIGSHPILGVGPGRYVMFLQARYGHESNPNVGEFKPVHDVALLAAAEGGVVAGALVIGLLLLVGWRAVQSGGAAVALFLCYLPFFLLDHFAYTFPQGTVITGLWLGFLDALARSHAGRSNMGATFRPVDAPTHEE